MPQDTVKSPTLSPQHAFVVQFHADTQIKAGQVTGHVEHVVSRQAITFQSLETLLTFMDCVLHEGEASQATDLG
jgi:hypothetical protein